MTNKDYKRFTNRYDEPMSHAGQYTDRLCYLEDCIENGTLVFLPCKVGDEFWCFAEYYSLSDGWITEIAKHTVHEIRILNNVIYLYDENDDEYDTSDIIIYFTKEAAEKALEELAKCKPLQ